MTPATIIAKFGDELLCSFVAGDGDLQEAGRLLKTVYNTPEKVRSICEQPLEFIGSSLIHCVPFYKNKRHFNQLVPFTIENLYWKLYTESYPESCFLYYWNGDEWLYFQIYNKEFEAARRIIAKDTNLSPVQKYVKSGELMYKYLTPIPEECQGLSESDQVRDILLDNFRKECRYL